MRRALTTPVLLALSLIACEDDLFAPGRRDIEGLYALAGTVDGKVGHSIAGTLDIERVRGSSADVWIEWRYMDRFGTVIRIDADWPARARVTASRIDFEFEGDLRIDGDWVPFVLIHDGWFDRGEIFGTWLFEMDLPTTDHGAFVASRERT